MDISWSKLLAFIKSVKCVIQSGGNGQELLYHFILPEYYEFSGLETNLVL